MTLGQAIPILATLNAEDKLRLIDLLARQLLEERAPAGSTATKSLRGVLKHFGPSPALEEFREVRQEMWTRSKDEPA
jgi:hypothetical protein